MNLLSYEWNPTVIILTDSYMDTRKARVVPGARWDPVVKAYVLDGPVTPRAALVALRMFPHLNGTAPELVAIRDAIGQDVRPVDYAAQWWDKMGTAQRADNVSAWGGVERIMRAAGKAPVPFQRQDISYLAAVLGAHGGAYLGWERGLGKTTATFGIAESTGAQRVLVVTPNTSKETVWLPHIEEFNGALGGLPWTVLPNAKTKREQALLWLQANRRNPQILVVHYEQLAIIRKQLRHWKQLGEWDLTVLDEAHHVANPKTQVARALKTIPSHMRLALSGSIIQNRADELFSPLQWLFPDRYRSKWADWNDRFLDFVDIGHREYIGVRVEMLDALRDELGRFMTYRRGEDELDLPPVTTEELRVQLRPAQRRVYEELRDFSIAQIEQAETVSAPNAIALLTRLRQVATGLSLVSDQLADSAKIDHAEAIIADNPDEPFVVFSYFVGAAEALAERLGERTAFLVTGNTPHAKRADYVRRFQAGERRVFIGTIGTLGESHTLDRAAQVVFLDRAWNPALNDQAVDRVAGGFRRKRHVTVTNLISIDTVDETNVTAVLADKRALRAMILGRL